MPDKKGSLPGKTEKREKKADKREKIIVGGAFAYSRWIWRADSVTTGIDKPAMSGYSLTKHIESVAKGSDSMAKHFYSLAKGSDSVTKHFYSLTTATDNVKTGIYEPFMSATYR